MDFALLSSLLTVNNVRLIVVCFFACAPPRQRLLFCILTDVNCGGLIEYSVLRFPNPLVKFVMFPFLIYQSSCSKQEHDATPTFSFIVCFNSSVIILETYCYPAYPYQRFSSIQLLIKESSRVIKKISQKNKYINELTISFPFCLM